MSTWTDDRLDELAKTTVWSRDAWQRARDMIEQYEMPDDVRQHIYATVETLAVSHNNDPKYVAGPLLRRIRRMPIRATSRRDGDT